MSTRTETPPATFIDEGAIITALIAGARADAGRIREIIAKAGEAKGLELDEVAALTTISDPELLGELFTTARAVKEDIYGKRLVLFAPLYVSNLCDNDCLYCAFRVRNKELKRRALTQDEIRREIEILVDQGHKRVLLVAGESYPEAKGFQYVLDSVATIYEVHRGNGEIRRVNVNIAPLTVDEFRALKGGRHRHLPALPGDLPPRRPTPRSTSAAASATTTGGRPPWTAPWRPASTTSASACCSACSTGASRRSPSCSTSTTWKRPSASARTRSACRASSRRSAPTSPASRRTPSPTSTFASSSPSCAWRCPTPA